MRICTQITFPTQLPSLRQPAEAQSRTQHAKPRPSTLQRKSQNPSPAQPARPPLRPWLGVLPRSASLALLPGPVPLERNPLHRPGDPRPVGQLGQALVVARFHLVEPLNVVVEAQATLAGGRDLGEVLV